MAQPADGGQVQQRTPELRREAPGEAAVQREAVRIGLHAGQRRRVGKTVGDQNNDWTAWTADEMRAAVEHLRADTTRALD